MAKNEKDNALKVDLSKPLESDKNNSKQAQSKPKQKPENDRKKAIGELIRALLAILVTAVFALAPIALFMLAGAIEFKMDFGVILILFLFICSVVAGFLIYLRGYMHRTHDAKAIYDAADKLMRGDYEIDLSDTYGDYKTIADALMLASQRLKQSDNEKNDFINDFSHELKTPIVSIRGFAKLIAKGNLSKEEEKEYLSIIVSESDRLIDLTASTLMLDRLGSNLEIENHYYDVGEQLRKTILLLQNDWEKKDIEFIAEFDDQNVLSNEELTSQLFLNVIQNAIKFSHPNGKIIIDVKKTDTHVAVSVQDFGIGMDGETKRRMYDKYFRGDKSRSTHGNGLGLSTVKRISELLGLELRVNSELGKGTTFTIIFKNK